MEKKLIRLDIGGQDGSVFLIDENKIDDDDLRSAIAASRKLEDGVFGLYEVVDGIIIQQGYAADRLYEMREKEIPIETFFITTDI